MNAFDCHVNRTPCSGTVEEILYKPGKFLNASFDKAREDNERNYYKLKDKNGNDWVSINIQGEGGKMYFPCKDHPSDEPNEGADLKISVPAHLKVAGPGLLQNVTTKKNK